MSNPLLYRPIHTQLLGKYIMPKYNYDFSTTLNFKRFVFIINHNILYV